MGPNATSDTIFARKEGAWQSLVVWGDGHNPKDRTQISAKVRQILKARHASNKKKKWRAGSVRLNAQEVAAAQSREPGLSAHFSFSASQFTVTA